MRLIFVYNANSGIFNSWMDIAHKSLSPTTYNCKLCQLTHGSFREKRAWKKFRDSSEYQLEFYHKDAFEKAFKSKWLPAFEFPVVLAAKGASLELAISAKQMDEFVVLEDLISEIERLNEV